jgi:hypothetical protein
MNKSKFLPSHGKIRKVYPVGQKKRIATYMFAVSKKRTTFDVRKPAINFKIDCFVTCLLPRVNSSLFLFISISYKCYRTVYEIDFSQLHINAI